MRSSLIGSKERLSTVSAVVYIYYHTHVWAQICDSCNQRTVFTYSLNKALGL